MEVVAVIWHNFFVAWLLLVICSDTVLYKVPNRYVLCGLVISASSQLYYYGIEGLFIWPVKGLFSAMMLYPMYAKGMLGAGDVKLSYVIGSYYGVVFAIEVNVLSLFPAAILAIFLCIKRKNFRRRLQVLAEFISQSMSNKKIMKYTDMTKMKSGRLPFGACMCFTTLVMIQCPYVVRRVIGWLMR